MKANTEIREDVLENEACFDDPFFQRFTLRPAPRPLQLTESISRTYRFPTFYRDVTCAIGIFLCDYGRAADLVAASLGDRVKPVKMTRKRSLVAFSCYEYKQVMNVAPYNEVAMTVPVMVDPAVNIPLLPMIADKWLKKFGYYVFDMPVTSLENQIRGNDIWGLPKTTRAVDITEKEGHVTTVAYEESGEPYFQLRVPTCGTPTEFDVTSNLYSRLGDTLFQSETNFKGTFMVNKFMGQLIQKDQTPDRNYLVIGDTPSAQALKDLHIDPHPFQFRFARKMTSCFDLPNPSFSSNIALPAIP